MQSSWNRSFRSWSFGVNSLGAILERVPHYLFLLVMTEEEGLPWTVYAAWPEPLHQVRYIPPFHPRKLTPRWLISLTSHSHVESDRRLLTKRRFTLTTEGSSVWVQCDISLVLLSYRLWSSELTGGNIRLSVATSKNIWKSWAVSRDVIIFFGSHGRRPTTFSTKPYIFSKACCRSCLYFPMHSTMLRTSSKINA